MSFKTTTLDFYDDKGALLRGAINREDLPDFVKSASVVDSENTPVNQYALVLVEDGRFIEIQGTAEAEPFDRNELDSLLSLAEKGALELRALQRAALGEK